MFASNYLSLYRCEVKFSALFFLAMMNSVEYDIGKKEGQMGVTYRKHKYYTDPA